MAADDSKKDLELEANARLEECRKWKSVRQQDFQECYFFAAPHRIRWQSSQARPPTTPIGDAAELQTSEAFLLAGDFVTQLVNTYMPEAQQWCERGPGT